MAFKDYYKVMGVAEEATQDVIKKAYKRLARRFHPDVSKEPDAEARFKEVGEAYEVLGDAAKRAEYDQLRRMGVDAEGRFSPPPGWEPGARRGSADGWSTADFSDFFEAAFGPDAAFRRGAPGREDPHFHGADLHVELALLLEESWRGSEQVVEYRVPELDERGVPVHRRKKLRIKVPAGTGDGSVLRMKGQGVPGPGGGPAGDLLITIKLAPHPLYAVDGRNLTLVVPVAPWEAALGGRVAVPTLGGRTLVTIPPNSQTGKRLRLAGQGMPGSPPGDLFLVLKVVMPDSTSERAAGLYRELEKAQAFNPRQGWEDKA